MLRRFLEFVKAFILILPDIRRHLSILVDHLDLLKRRQRLLILLWHLQLLQIDRLLPRLNSLRVLSLELRTAALLLQFLLYNIPGWLIVITSTFIVHGNLRSHLFIGYVGFLLLILIDLTLSSQLWWLIRRLHVRRDRVVIRRKEVRVAGELRQRYHGPFMRATNLRIVAQNRDLPERARIIYALLHLPQLVLVLLKYLVHVGVAELQLRIPIRRLLQHIPVSLISIIGKDASGILLLGHLLIGGRRGVLRCLLALLGLNIIIDVYRKLPSSNRRQMVIRRRRERHIQYMLEPEALHRTAHDVLDILVGVLRFTARS